MPRESELCKFYCNSPLRCAAGLPVADLRARVESILRMSGARIGEAGRWHWVAALFSAVAGPAVVGFLTAPAAFAQQANSFVDSPLRRSEI